MSRVVGSGGPEGEARRRSPKAKPEGEAPPKSRPILLTPLKRPTPPDTENSTQRTPSGGGMARKPQTNAEKARPIARRARAAAAAEAEARRGNRTPRRHQPRAHSQTGRRYLEDKQTRRGPEKQKVLFRVPTKTQSPTTHRRPEKTQTNEGDRSPDQTRPPDPQRRPTDPPESALTSNCRSISGLELAGAAEFGALRRLRRRPRRQPAVSATARACPLLQTRPHPPPRPRAAASTAGRGSVQLQPGE